MCANWRPSSTTSTAEPTKPPNQNGAVIPNAPTVRDGSCLDSAIVLRSSRARFDEDGVIVESTWPPLGNLLSNPRLGGTLQGSVDLQLVPGDRPTGVSVTIREGEGEPTRFTEPVVPFDGSFFECPEQERT